MEKLPYFEDLLKDQQSVKNYRQMRETVSKFCNDMLSYANETLGWCIERAKESEKTFHTSLIGLGRHNLVYMDCITTLLANGNVEGCQPLLRSMLESMLGIMHIVEKDSENRGLAYRFYRIKQMIKHYQMGDKSHEEGKRIEQEMNNDMYSPKVLDDLSSKNYAATAAEIERQLATDEELQPVLAEWERLTKPSVQTHTCKSCKAQTSKKQKRSNPEWYSLFGTAKTVRDLAKSMNCVSLYLFMYKDMSNHVHAGTALDNLTINESLRPLRYTKGYDRVLEAYFLMFIQTYWKLAVFFDSNLGDNFERYVKNRFHPELVAIVKSIQRLGVRSVSQD